MRKYHCERCGGPSDGIYKHCSRCVSVDLAEMMAERCEDREEKYLIERALAAGEQLFRELLINPSILPRCAQGALVGFHKTLHALNKYRVTLRENRPPKQEGKSALDSAGGVLGGNPSSR